MINRVLRAALIVLLVIGVSAAHAQENTPESPLEAADVSDCQSLMVNPPPLTDPPMQAHIISPQDGNVVYGSRVVMEIATENFSLTDGGHWHVWVNGTLYGMVFEPRTVLELQPGTYRICANLGSATHLDEGIPDGITITVQAAAVGTFTPVIDPAVRAPQAEPAANPFLILLLGGFAAAAGLLIGTRLGKRSPAPREKE